MTQTSETRLPVPTRLEQHRWSRTFRGTFWLCRLRRGDLDHIERAVLERMPPDPSVEYVHTQPEASNKGKRIPGPGSREESVLTAPTLDQLVDCLDQAARGKRGHRRRLYRLTMRCAAEGHVFELRVGTARGGRSIRVRIHSTWPGREESTSLQTVWERLIKRSRLWRVRAAAIWFLALELVGVAAVAYGHRVSVLLGDPTVSRDDLYGEIIAEALAGLIGGLILLTFCREATASRVDVRPGVLASSGAGILAGLRGGLRRFMQAVVGDEPRRSTSFATFILTAVSVLLGILAFVFSRR